jgi:hypothetical protein
MQFGIFFEMSTPRPWNGDVERTVWHNALEQARVADELGFDWVWAVEHHFLEEYSHCSAPELVLASVAAHVSGPSGSALPGPTFPHPEDPGNPAAPARHGDARRRAGSRRLLVAPRKAAAGGPAQTPLARSGLVRHYHSYPIRPTMP